MTTTTEPIVTIAQDTAKGQLLHPELIEKVPAVYSRMPITVAQHELITWWSEGLINDAAYIFFALKVERVGGEGIEDFDVTKFCDDWLGFGKGDKEKRLKESAVTAFIQKLQQKGAATVELAMQLRLEV